jgi:FAD/FMN-containing dehydrogenase
VSRVRRGSNAYGNRDASLLLQMTGLAPSREAYDRFGRYADQVKQRLQPYLTGGVYMNFLEGEESQQRVQDGYSPEDYRRLRALKAAYDPDDRLRSGFDLGPMG